ncbi:MAG: glutaminyl-peptide cyclotransferase [Panacagrimonas sp.]|nr:glutaminyl-peptide cyclotransferase [Panacagrimonas sp.]
MLDASARSAVDDAPVPCERSWSLAATHPHDTAHFTQGLTWVDGRVFESVGQYGRSGVHEIDLATGRSLRSHSLPAEIFGEGLTRIGDRLVQLSWREKTAYLYDLSLQPKGTLHYEGEGWGLTTLPGPAGPSLVLSDGTPWLRMLDPATLAERRRVMVRVGDEPVKRLNELEWVRGEILANIWYSDEVAVIDPDDGRLRGWFDFTSLRERLVWPAPTAPSRDAVLNGLAWDDRRSRLLVTGKNWPQLFEIEIGDCRAPRPPRQ